MARHVRLLTVTEVNALIPKLELLMERVQRIGMEIEESVYAAAREIGVDPEDLPLPDLLRRHPELRPAVEELERLVGRIDACGGQFKGMDLGLVDFFAEIDGRLSLLCWQFGEKEVRYWHELDGGFQGRRPLPAARPAVLQ